MKHLKFLLFLVIVLTSFSSSTGRVSASSYPSAVVWNNLLYGLSTEEVEINEIGNEIGKIDRKRTPMPEKNGESNEKPVGSLLFEIKGTPTLDAIAVKVDNKFFRATQLRPIQVKTDVPEDTKAWIAILLVICVLILLTLIRFWKRKRRSVGS